MTSCIVVKALHTRQASPKLLKEMDSGKLAEREFVYCGKKIAQSDSGDIVVSQREVTEKLEENPCQCGKKERPTCAMHK